MPTFEELLGKPPLERTVTVPLSEEAVAAYEAASKAHGQAELAKKNTTATAAAMEKARKQVEATSAVLRFRSIGRKRWEELLEAHPGDDENTYGPDFVIAAVAASMVEPTMTIEQVRALSDEWNLAEFLPLWHATMEVNTQRRVADLGKGSRRTGG